MTPENLVKLDDIAESYFSLQPERARRKAALGTLPVPAFRLGNTRKGIVYVTKESLDDYLNKRVTEAVKLHRQMAHVRTECA